MDAPTPTVPANFLSPQKWAETIKAAIEDMRHREGKYRRESSDALLMAETLTDARQNLESALYKAGLTK
jgi:hypothetical protein